MVAVALCAWPDEAAARAAATIREKRTALILVIIVFSLLFDFGVNDPATLELQRWYDE